MGKNLYVVTFYNDYNDYNSHYFHNLERARAFILEAYDDECCDDKYYDPKGAALELEEHNVISDYALIECCQFSDKED